MIEKFLDPTINLGPEPVLAGDGSVKLPGLDNHAMGTIFEDLVRRFNEDNNEEAGKHWTHRDAVKLMANLIFLPVAEQIKSVSYLLYDAACGTGGMLTVAEETLTELAERRGKKVVTHLYGQEINAETYAICKADLLLKGEGEAADNIYGGPEYSTLSNDAFAGREFDFMLSNPPYCKSWKGDLERLGGKKGMKDPRFVIERGGDPDYSLVTRSSDGQLLFLANMLSKMEHASPLGSRIAEVHNGSSLFTGDAGQGESNIRRWIIENDWLEAVVALPSNMFYNTDIATFIWVLSNRKPVARRGLIQLIDATDWYAPLPRALGKKSRELTAEHIAQICASYLDFIPSEQSKIFRNEDFGYWRTTIERPLRALLDEPLRTYNASEVRGLRQAGLVNPAGQPVIRRIYKTGTAADAMHGLFEIAIDGMPRVVEYEPDVTLRDAESISFTEPGGISEYFAREVLPFAPDAWIDPHKTQLGYEISFSRHFYRAPKQRELSEIREAVYALEAESKEILDDLVGGTQ